MATQSGVPVPGPSQPPKAAAIGASSSGKPKGYFVATRGSGRFVYVRPSPAARLRASVTNSVLSPLMLSLASNVQALTSSVTSAAANGPPQRAWR